MLSEDIENLHHQLFMTYTDKPSGAMLTPEDFHAILGRLWKMYEESLELEKSVPPEPPAITGDNIVDFQKLRNTTKPQRRI